MRTYLVPDGGMLVDTRVREYMLPFSGVMQESTPVPPISISGSLAGLSALAVLLLRQTSDSGVTAGVSGLTLALHLLQTLAGEVGGTSTVDASSDLELGAAGTIDAAAELAALAEVGAMLEVLLAASSVVTCLAALLPVFKLSIEDFAPVKRQYGFEVKSRTYIIKAE